MTSLDDEADSGFSEAGGDGLRDGVEEEKEEVEVDVAEANGSDFFAANDDMLLLGKRGESEDTNGVDDFNAPNGRVEGKAVGVESWFEHCLAVDVKAGVVTFPNELLPQEEVDAAIGLFVAELRVESGSFGFWEKISLKFAIGFVTTSVRGG